MPGYHHRDVSFDPPPDWMDATVANFHPKPPPSGSPPAPLVSMSQEPIAADETLRSFADRLLVRLARMAPEFELVDSEPVMVAERAGIWLRFRFKSAGQGAPMEQTMVLVGLGRDQARRVAIFTLVCPAEASAQNGALFAAMLRSVRFDESAEQREVSAAPMRTTNRPPPTFPDEIPLGPMPGSRKA